jgi:predicted transcriptional regulator
MKQLSRAFHFMYEDVPQVSREASLAEVAAKICASRSRAVLVVDPDGSVVGVITDATLAKALSEIAAISNTPATSLLPEAS